MKKGPGRPRRISTELTSIRFSMLLGPSEYLALRDAAVENGESMAEYVRRAVSFRFAHEHQGRKLPFGQPWRT